MQHPMLHIGACRLPVWCAYVAVALQMVTDLLLERGDSILVEEYTYFYMVDSVLPTKGYDAVPMKMDNQGICPTTLGQVYGCPFPYTVVHFLGLPSCSARLAYASSKLADADSAVSTDSAREGIDQAGTQSAVHCALWSQSHRSECAFLLPFVDQPAEYWLQ